MDIFSNHYLIENISNLISAGTIAFIISFLSAPLVGKLAQKVGAVDIPARMRRSGDTTSSRRLHSIPTPRFGGLAMLIAIIIGLYLTNSFEFIPKGILVGAVIIIILGILDDILEIDGKVQLLFQIAAAAVVVLSGISITSFHFLGTQFSFDLFSAFIEFAGYTYNFIFPADLITLLWIVGMINVINWVGGVDALNGSISSLAILTIMLLVISSGNIPLAIIMAVHLGGILGILPYNYNPARIYYGSVGDYLNGYLLAIFAIIGSTRWTATLILLGLPIIDGLLVMIIRFRDHPELRKQPWKILSISDTNHLHHRLLDAGYSRKTVTLVEVAIMAVLCSIALVFSDLRIEIVAFILSLTIILVSFTVIFFQRKRAQKKLRLELLRKQLLEEETEPKKEAIVNTIYEEEEDKKFVY